MKSLSYQMNSMQSMLFLELIEVDMVIFDLIFQVKLDLFSLCILYKMKKT